METHFDILIDASGSMGYMKGTDDENKCLLPDGSTRTDLVKKILINNLIPSLWHLKVVRISTFYMTDKPKKSHIYWNKFDINEINRAISKIDNPKNGSTPLFYALKDTMKAFRKSETIIILITDGQASDDKDFDHTIIQEINNNDFKVKIFIIGISQSIEAQNKCLNLTKFTNGEFVNISAMNYENALFDNFLFEIKTSINQEALSTAVAQNITVTQQQPIISEPQKQETVEEQEPPKEALEEVKKSSSQEDQSLKQEVANNSLSLKLISEHLQTISSQVSYLSKVITSRDTDEFIESDEDELVNKQTGKHCENVLFDKFKTFKWKDLIWLNENEEQYKPYDFTVLQNDVTIFIECKGTRSNSNEFALTKDEWQFYLDNKPNYRLYFVRSMVGQPVVIFKFEDLLGAFENKELLPFSSVNRKVKANRIWFQVNNKDVWQH
ncbi:von Willebrand factor type A domain-containing protein [Flavobacteriaceae bacterium MAR_2010_72]|nr:von Willebrand factor type A domain-containing protein [Flavobacteriaceae bacterium MAR_2010_72]